MAERIPTRVGDVLILQTDDIPTLAVGVIHQDGGQDFYGRTDLSHVRGRAAAKLEAQGLVAPDGRTFIKSMETGAWSEISN
jgi:hypothetical protein